MRKLSKIEVSRLTQKVILNYFNHENNPDKIVELIQDNPYQGKASPRAYGIRAKVAQRLVEDSSKPFSVLEQLISIEGIGSDTYSDIIFSFQRMAPERKALIFLNTENDPQTFVDLDITDLTTAELIIEYRQSFSHQKFTHLNKSWK